MSIPVKIDDLATTLNDFDIAYLLTSGDSGVKVVCVHVALDGDTVLIPTASKGTERNLQHGRAATLMCPPRQPRGWTLIVDGDLDTDPGTEGFRLTPAKAVLHRPADHADGPVADDGCGHDCTPVS